MNQLNREVYITIDKKYPMYVEVYDCFGDAVSNVKSVTGLDVVNIVITLSELIVLIITMPVIQDAFFSGHIIVMIGGIKFNDTVSRIIEEAQKDPVLLKEAKEAYIGGTMTIEGKVEAVQSFRAKLQLLIDNMENEQ